MRKLLFAILSIAGCSQPASSQTAKDPEVECTFQVSAEPACLYKTSAHSVKVLLTIKRLAEDEIALINANVIFDGKPHTLSISPDVTMIKGDIGIVNFADINFDKIPDIAVSTSFGVANQYYDYWTYDPDSKSYHSIGNYPKLSINPTDRTLSATVKQNAAVYQTQKYFWNGRKLIKK